MSEIKEEQVPSTPTLSEKQLKELEMFFQKQSQMSTEASSSSNVAAAVNEPQPTVIADEPRPIAVADEPQQKSTSRRPRNSRFFRQELPASRPILTPKWVMTILTLVGLIFIPIGIGALIASKNVVEVRMRYDDICIPGVYKDDAITYIKDAKINKTCGSHRLIIKKKMKAPIYMYYELHNFHQNHHRYVQSKSNKQLRNKGGEKDVGSCSPLSYTANNEPIVPCGLIAWSLFNDTYRIFSNDKELKINKKDIAWKSDKHGKFGSDVHPKNFQTEGLIGGGKLDENIPLSEQEDLMVWMRTAALPNFRKLYGKIEVDIEAQDNIEIVIENNYNSYEYQGKKSVVLSTTSWMGGKNDFPGIMLVAVGGLCLLLSLTYAVMCMLIPEDKKIKYV
ncbi:ALA-interacting subunit [Trifolium repens]|nr:ALA-interacting subunit [Trifolium repens]